MAAAVTHPHDSGLGAGRPADMPRTGTTTGAGQALAHPHRRLADRLLDAGVATARRFVEADRYDPGRPSLGALIAETLAEHERIGEERILTRIRDLIEQRTTLRDERMRIAERDLADRQFDRANANTAWANDLDGQISALRLLLTAPPEDPT
jgi:hypothetical protein